MSMKLKTARAMLIGVWVLMVAGYFLWRWDAFSILIVSGAGAMVEGAIRQKR
jgi:hypothetical protein